MDHATLDTLKRAHPAWRLLAADHAPMVVGFLFATFIQPNVRTVPQQTLVSQLDDYLHHLRARLGDDAFPRSASQYLETWADDEHGWLRKYYAPDDDEPRFDITNPTEKAIDWLASLKQRQFVGTESRVIMVFELLRQMTEGSEVDPEARIAELEKRRAAIDAEIHRIRGGQLDLLDATQIKDRFQQMASTARGLLSDFREVEGNFRDLDRAVRERIATWSGAKGALLQDVFGERDAIGDSDQGKSFRSFWDLLMSPTRQDELSSLLDRVFALPAVKELEPDRRLLRIHYDWLDAGEIAQRTVARVSQQLRRYLDDQVWLENRRIMQIIRQIEQRAVELRSAPPEGHVMELDDTAPTIELPMERPPFTPPHKPRIAETIVAEGDQGISADVLFEQVYVDKARLAAHIRAALRTRAQVSLAELCEAHPLEQGLAELVAYMTLAAADRKALIDDQETQTLFWNDPVRGLRQATMPLVVFTR